ncbi:hypothetical protein ADIAG_00470 [Paeniglutamicibacter gangotriensis Lz1y]|uniref:Uncharacterized protein n=1 Tax=Paeniglutamicibacter gangotriensis Lz1y TaxID=1276920 RepID=M7MVJ5_9MICC|nr:hypothetical protein ADIAG_00470 [Paeniglutamicibacter gangotriensis Lz1y]
MLAAGCVHDQSRLQRRHLRKRLGQRSEPVTLRTLRMIADEAAVNVSTVSRVINFSDKEICRWASGEMIERIRVVVAAPGYLRRPQPHGLRGNR